MLEGFPVDGATRLAYVEILDDERGPTSTGFLGCAVAWFAAHGVRIERVIHTAAWERRHPWRSWTN